MTEKFQARDHASYNARNVWRFSNIGRNRRANLLQKIDALRAAEAFDGVDP